MGSEKQEVGNEEFGSWIWKGIELGPEKWEMGMKSEFSSLKVRPLAASGVYKHSFYYLRRKPAGQ